MGCTNSTAQTDARDLPTPPPPPGSKITYKCTPGRFSERYKIEGLREIGHGNFSVVKKGIIKKTKQPVAVKCVRKFEITKEDEDAVFVEVNVLQRVRCKQAGSLERTLSVFDWPVCVRARCSSATRT